MAFLAGWSKRQKLTIDHTQVDDELTDFPVKVIIPSDNPLFYTAKNDGSDVRFTAADGETLLKFEREVHDTTEKIAMYHVKIPSVSSTNDTNFYMYYGNTNASDASTPNDVWDSDYKLVMHMGPSLEDSTSNGNDGTYVSGTYGVDSAGYFMKDDVKVTLPSISLGTKEYTVTVHIIIHTLEDYTEFVNNNNWSGVTMHTSANGTVYAGTSTSDRIVTSSGCLLTGTEYVITIRLDGASGHTLYRNETIVASNSKEPTPSYGTGYIGGAKCDATIYEVRMSSVARSDAWIKATSASLHDELLTIGSEESALPPIQVVQQGIQVIFI